MKRETRNITKQTISDRREYDDFMNILDGDKDLLLSRFNLSIELTTQLVAEEGMVELAFLN